MNQDAIFNKFVSQLKLLIDDEREALCSIDVAKLAYHQGRIAGLREALVILTGVMDEMDR